MIPVLESVKPIAAAAKHVRINNDAIERFCRSVGVADLAGSEYDEETLIPGLGEEDYLAFCFVDCALNFCYWGEPKWAVQINGHPWDGSAALIRCLKQAVERGYPLLKSKYLASMPEEDLAEIFAGNVIIPLFKERLHLLHELGRVVEEQFGGSFTSVVDQAGWDSLQLIDLLVKQFPGVFNDMAKYHGHQVGFYKRVQLLPVQLHDLFSIGILRREIASFYQVTAMADYKIPQLQRKFGLLEYSPELARKVDNLIELAPGSDEEVEIRAATIWVCELVSQELSKKFGKVAPARVGNLFWWKGQVKLPDDKPYHRTRTVWY